MKVKGFSDVGQGEKSGFKRDSKFPHKKAHHEGEWNRGQDTSKGEKPKQFQGSGFKPKENFVKKGAPFKGANPREMLVGNLRDHVSIIMKWAITPRIAPNPNWKMGLLRGFP
jgi:hypothetical protein